MSTKGHLKAERLWIDLSRLKIELDDQATAKVLEKLERDRRRREARESPLATVDESNPPDAESTCNLPTRSDSAEHEAPNLTQATHPDPRGVEGDGHGNEDPRTSTQEDDEYKDIEPGEECRFPMRPSGFLNGVDIRNLYPEDSGPS